MTSIRALILSMLVLALTAGIGTTASAAPRAVSHAPTSVAAGPAIPPPNCYNVQDYLDANGTNTHSSGYYNLRHGVTEHFYVVLKSPNVSPPDSSENFTIWYNTSHSRRTDESTEQWEIAGNPLDLAISAANVTTTMAYTMRANGWNWSVEWYHQVCTGG